MTCPRCQGALYIRGKKGVEIDFCKSCGGIWLDAGELEKIMDHTGKTPPLFKQHHKEQDEVWMDEVLETFCD